MLPPYVTREVIFERLPQIFPVGTPNRNNLVREVTASTIFVALYIGAVENSPVILQPKHVYRMTKKQALLSNDSDRNDYDINLKRKKFIIEGERWYLDNSREQIRDEALREGLVFIGAFSTQAGVGTTANKPRYIIKRDFAALFDPNHKDLENAIRKWRIDNLSENALRRVALANLVSSNSDGKVVITFPNMTTRLIAAGKSSMISKAVIEDFAIRFLGKPGVLWLSSSDNKVSPLDDKLAASIGLKIDAGLNLPDIILVDLGTEKTHLIFIEVVATDGAVTELRRASLLRIAEDANYDASQVYFVTAFMDRQSTGFTKTIKNLAWNTFVWLVSEPDKIILFRDGVQNLSELSK
ncbi:MAG: BsuBI/PstI family type II restriction endonuclease [Chryseolinea sp.]